MTEEKQIQNIKTDDTKSHLFERFLENQEKELEFKTKELTLKQQKDNNAFNYGKEALAAKVEDRKHQRIHEKGYE